MSPTPILGDDPFPWEEKGEPAASAGERTSMHRPRRAEEASDDRASPERGAARDRPVAPKEYYAISEVCDLVGLKPHVLRYWETQFAVLNPSKNRSGNRVYQRKEIKLILLVKHLLYEEKYTVEGARAKLEKLRRGGTLRDSTDQALDSGMVTLLRQEIRELARILTPPGK